MAYATTAQVVSDAAIELGLVTADVANPFASTDPNIIQLTRLLNGLGRDLVREWEWAQLVTPYTFSTVASTAGYALPADFDHMINQTGWNRTTRLPVGGPISPQAWEYLQALPNSATLTVLFRKNQGQIVLYPTPSSVQTIAYEYLSNYWVAASSTRSAESTTVAGDTLYYDRRLLVTGAKMRFMEAKGFPTQNLQDDFVSAFESAKNQDPAPVLNLNQKSPLFPLLDGKNVPFTGYGS